MNFTRFDMLHLIEFEGANVIHDHFEIGVNFFFFWLLINRLTSHNHKEIWIHRQHKNGGVMAKAEWQTQYLSSFLKLFKKNARDRDFLALNKWEKTWLAPFNLFATKYIAKQSNESDIKVHNRHTQVLPREIAIVGAKKAMLTSWKSDKACKKEHSNEPIKRIVCFL